MPAEIPSTAPATAAVTATVPTTEAVIPLHQGKRIVQIESLDQEGRGVTHVEGKTIFIEGALIGERVTYTSYRKKPTFEMAQVDAMLSTSSQRVTPHCPHFGVCGGCSMQHLDASAQVAVKQRVLEEALQRIGLFLQSMLLKRIQHTLHCLRHGIVLREAIAFKQGVKYRLGDQVLS